MGARHSEHFHRNECYDYVRFTTTKIYFSNIVFTTLSLHLYYYYNTLDARLPSFQALSSRKRNTRACNRRREREGNEREVDGEEGSVGDRGMPKSTVTLYDIKLKSSR